jgi:hypothetical protein
VLRFEQCKSTAIESRGHSILKAECVSIAVPRLNIAKVISSLESNPYVGTFGVFLGAGIATLNGRMINVALPDLRGAL